MRFLREPFRISPQSNRMAAVLEGRPLSVGHGDILSHGVVTGTIQLPPSGLPIVLMTDRQTTGGYPVLGHVASVDFPVLASTPPGTTLAFREIAVEAAQAELARLHIALERRKHAIQLKRPGS